jgi:hypothetical protein
VLYGREGRRKRNVKTRAFSSDESRRGKVDADAINLTSEDDAHRLTVLPWNRYCGVGGASVGGKARVLGLRWAHGAAIETGSWKEKSRKRVNTM